MTNKTAPRPQVLVVEASAGSGKTYCLSKRYVQLSLELAARRQNTPIQSILAITFTNKATLAMKSRILDFLKRIALQELKPEETADILNPLGLDEKSASGLAFGLMNDVIRQYHYFQVQTIDSFVNILLVGCSFKIGLSAKFKIQRNSRQYLQMSLDELLDRSHETKGIRGLFENFVHQYLFLENRSGWFPREDLLKVMAELFKQYNTYQKPLVLSPGYDQVFLRKRNIYRLLQELKTHCPSQVPKRFQDNLNELLAKDNGVFDVDDLSDYFAKEDFPVNKGGEVSGACADLWRKITREVHDLCLLEACGMFNPYVALFEKALGSFEAISRRDDLLFLEELNHKASLLFAGLVTVEELYFRLAARFQHYLIDEFQDTSVSQWQNLSSMIGEALAHGGSLFYVGDKKQAIYAFRGGESRLFDALQAQLQGFNVQAMNLDKNYRSCPFIIDFNNRVFGLENLKGFLRRRLEDSKENKRRDIHFSESDFCQIENVFRHAHQWPGKGLSGGVVRVSFLEGRLKQERSDDARRKLMAILGELKGRFALKDIAILTRGNSEVEEVTHWLLQEGIAATSERSSDIKGNPMIVELMNLLSFLYSPVDNDAFAQFCLGDLMPSSTGIKPEAIQGFLFDCARTSTHETRVCFYEKFQESFPEVWKTFFADFLELAGVCPLYELTAGIIQRFGCERLFPQYHGFFMHLLELIKLQETESCDLSSFLEFYENLEGEDRFVITNQMEAVKVLTVHKAKGLEFPVVIVPFLEMDIKAGSGGRDGGQAYVLDIQEEGLGLIRLKESYRRFAPEIQEKYELEYKKAFLIELNNVYVALTRAIEELYVFVPPKVGNAVNPAIFLVPEDCLSIGVPSDRPAAHETPQAHQKISPFVQDPWMSLQKEFSKEPAVSAASARKSEFYHAVLMRLGAVDQENLDLAVEKAWIGASRLFTPPEDEKRGMEFIRCFINRDDVRPFFYLSNICHSCESGSSYRTLAEARNPEIQVFCEKEFVNTYGDTKRLDRMIVSKDEVHIVDFKLSAAGEKEHQKQLQEYVELARQFYPQHKVTGRLLYLSL